VEDKEKADGQHIRNASAVIRSQYSVGKHSLHSIHGEPCLEHAHDAADPLHHFRPEHLPELRDLRSARTEKDACDRVSEHPDQGRDDSVSLRHGHAVHQRTDSGPCRCNAQSVKQCRVFLESLFDCSNHILLLSNVMAPASLANRRRPMSLQCGASLQPSLLSPPFHKNSGPPYGEPLGFDLDFTVYSKAYIPRICTKHGKTAHESANHCVTERIISDLLSLPSLP